MEHQPDHPPHRSPAWAQAIYDAEQRQAEAYLRTPEGEAERQAHNAAVAARLRQKRAPAMAKRHFVLVADVLQRFVCSDAADDAERLFARAIAREFADELRRTNPEFKRERFLRACGLDL